MRLSVEMAEVLRLAVPALDLELLRERPDPVVLRGITLVPKHGVRVRVLARRGLGGASAPALAQLTAR